MSASMCACSDFVDVTPRLPPQLLPVHATTACCSHWHSRGALDSGARQEAPGQEGQLSPLIAGDTDLSPSPTIQSENSAVWESWNRSDSQ